VIEFSARRFGRVIRNDALRIARLVLFTTVALCGLTLFIYMFNARSLGGEAQTLPLVLFGIYMVGTGLLLTGSIFHDMHHRLERYQYLMLPVSSLERLLSRFLLTGPLFVLYSFLAFMVFDFAGKQLVRMYWGIHQPLLPLFSTETKWLVYSYAWAHLAMFIGAICFRTYAFLRTLLSMLAAFLALILVENFAQRIFFPELFSWARFERLAPLPVELMPGFSATWMNIAFMVGVFGWLVYVSYACLRDHEASDGV
jgi:hypothetical protein